MRLGVADSLALLGVNPDEIVKSPVTFERQKETYALHVVEDRPVCNRYVYFINNNRIFIDENFQEELFIDPEERNGLAALGTIKAINLALSNPDKVIFLYSPPGPVSFASGTKYDKVVPYPSGQLYLLTSTEEKKVNVMAISVSKENEQKFLRLFGLGISGSFDDEIKKITYYLTNPIVFNGSIDDFLDYLGKNVSSNDFLVYQNIHGRKYSLSDIFYYLRLGWNNEIKPFIPTNYLRSYIDIIMAYAPLYSRNNLMPLGGSCGGRSVNLEIFGNNPFNETQLTPLSTSYREISLNASDSDQYGVLEFECPVCHNIHRRKRGELMTHCPNRKDINGNPIPIPEC